MSKLIKRKDGSYSKRGLWDNIRKNKGSGKEPTKEMLKQESKIKKEENMKSMYKRGGKKMKGESFMEESKEIDFQAPGVKPPMKYMMGGLETGMQANARQNRAEGKASMAGKKKMYKTGGVKKYEDGGQKPGDPLKATADSSVYFSNQRQAEFKTQADLVKNSKPGSSLDSIFKSTPFQESRKREETARSNQARQANKGKTGYDKDGYPVQKMMGGKYKKGGAKTMEPGGGGRFAKMVSGLKKEGKSEDSAKAIAASVGRKKYGKSRFQAMAAAGKKKMMGGKKC
jgi:hypothetical protein